MGAEIVIGSYAGFHLKNQEELQTATGIIKQIGFHDSVSQTSTMRKKRLTILIEPEVKDLPSMEFNNHDTIIDSGLQAALVYRDEFRRLADSLNRLAPQKPIETIYLTGNTILLTGLRLPVTRSLMRRPDNWVFWILSPRQKVDRSSSG